MNMCVTNAHLMEGRYALVDLSFRTYGRDHDLKLCAEHLWAANVKTDIETYEFRAKKVQHCL